MTRGLEGGGGCRLRQNTVDASLPGEALGVNPADDAWAAQLRVSGSSPTAIPYPPNTSGVLSYANTAFRG